MFRVSEAGKVADAKSKRVAQVVHSLYENVALTLRSPPNIRDRLEMLQYRSRAFVRQSDVVSSVSTPLMRPAHLQPEQRSAQAQKKINIQALRFFEFHNLECAITVRGVPEFQNLRCTFTVLEVSGSKLSCQRVSECSTFAARACSQSRRLLRARRLARVRFHTAPEQRFPPSQPKCP